jgi:hypothetical protein
MYQKGVYYSDIRVFNGLPTGIKDISDSPVKFKTALKRFLYLHSFYTVEEYYNRYFYLYTILVYLFVILSHGSFWLCLALYILVDRTYVRIRGFVLSIGSCVLYD